MLHYGSINSKPARIAIVLSGQLRDFKDCFPSFYDNILKHNNCHIYMHTYIPAHMEEVSQAIKLYKPQRVILDRPIKNFRALDDKWWPKNFREFYSKQGTLATRKDALYWQYRNLQIAFQTIPPNTYDCVVKTRYDITYHEPIDFLTYDMKNINVPYTDPEKFEGGILDLFAFSCYDHMRHYCNLFDRINTYVENESAKCIPEVLLRYHLRTKPVFEFYFPICLRGCWLSEAPRK